MPAYEDLMSFQSQTEALAQISGRQDWDQETMMPSGAADQRGEESAAMEGVMHARRSDPRIGDWLIQCEDADLDAVGKAALFLLSDNSLSTTGEIIYVDGGYHVMGLPILENL